MLNSFSPWKYVILKPSDPCVLLYASSALIICLALLYVNLVTDEKIILTVFEWQNTIPFM